MISIYVGNVPFKATEKDLEPLFAAHGQVDSVRIIMDRMTGQSRGFAFVQMADKQAGEQAVEAVNGQELMGKTLRVNEARPREDRPARSGGHRDGGNRNFGGNRDGGNRNFGGRF